MYFFISSYWWCDNTKQPGHQDISRHGMILNFLRIFQNGIIFFFVIDARWIINASWNWAIPGSANGLSHVWCLTVTSILSTGTSGTHFNKGWIEMPNISFWKMHLEICKTAKFQPYCQYAHKLRRLVLAVVRLRGYFILNFILRREEHLITSGIYYLFSGFTSALYMAIDILLMAPLWETWLHSEGLDYCQISDIRHTKSQKLIVPCLV